MLLRRAIPDPNGGDGELVSFACEVGSRFVRGQMLSHFVRRAHPNDGIVKPISFARDVGSQLARRHMLARSVRAGCMLLRGAVPP